MSVQCFGLSCLLCLVTGSIAIAAVECWLFKCLLRMFFDASFSFDYCCGHGSWFDGLLLLIVRFWVGFGLGWVWVLGMVFVCRVCHLDACFWVLFGVGCFVELAWGLFMVEWCLVLL